MGHVVATYDQVAFRFRDDDGSETGATWLDTENVAPSGFDVTNDHQIRLRIAIQEIAGGAENNVDLTLQYRLNGGTWTNVSGSADTVTYVTSSFVANGIATTDQLTAPTGAFVVGTFVSISGSTARSSFAGNDHTENEYSLILISADLSGGDVLDFRTLATGAVLSTYSQMPTVNLVTSQSEAGGSTSTVAVTASGGGSATEAAEGGATATVQATATGAGEAAEEVVGGSVATVLITATGAGDTGQHEVGGSVASVPISATGGGAGTEEVAGGAAALLVASATGGGTATEAATGGSTAGVAVTTTGAGAALEVGEGGSTATVLVSTTGGGEGLDTLSGGSTSTILISASGDGSATDDVVGGSTATVLATASGGGEATETATGGSVATVVVTTTGGGSNQQIDAGGSTATVTVSATGGGSAEESASGGSTAVVFISATGGGFSIRRDITVIIGPPTTRVELIDLLLSQLSVGDVARRGEVGAPASRRDETFTVLSPSLAVASGSSRAPTIGEPAARTEVAAPTIDRS